MWLIQLFLLAAALSCSSTAGESLVTEYKLPEAFVDGTIITFYFWHSIGDRDSLYLPDFKTQYAYMNFYDVASVDKDTVYDIPAQLRMETDYFYPVTSNTFQDGKWHKEQKHFQIMNGLNKGGEWWRVDVYKHDSYRLNVFFKGFWSGVRTFQMSLDNIKSINIVSEYVEPKWVEVQYKAPNNNLPPMSFDVFNSFLNTKYERQLMSYKFVNFTIGSSIDMIAFLRSAEDPTQLSSFGLSKDGKIGNLFLEIWQEYAKGQKVANQRLILDDVLTPNPVFCTEYNGDLQHLRLERTTYDTIKVTVSIRGTKWDSRQNETCELVLDNVYFYNNPFTIMIRFGGAMMLHLEHTIARFEEK